MPHRILLLLGVLTLVGCRNNHEGAVKLTVTYSGFKPGCLRVGVKDAAGAGETRTTELPGKGAASGGTVTVAAFREAGWSPTLTLTAELFEARCQGTPVRTASETVTVSPGEVTETELRLAATDADGDGYVSRADNGTDCDDTRSEVSPGATELCNDRDDDCDGTADDGLDLGLACTSAWGCSGKRACATDGGVLCDGPTPVMLYPDEDKDTHGAADAGVASCEPTRPGHVSNADDCDDTRAHVYAGAPELCDALDNDCDRQVDEDFTLGAGCNPGLGCSGVTACAADGGTRCAFTTPPSTYYPDDDLDLHGKTDAGVLTCAPDAGHTLVAGDCNDGNPFTHGDARELCDREDNDCDGVPDPAGTCPGDNPAWVAAEAGDTTTVWRTVHPWGDGGVWVAGDSGRRARKSPGESGFTSLSSGCSGDWRSLWVDPATGRAYLGGLAGKLGIQERDSASCTVEPPSAGDSNTRGLWAPSLDGGGMDLYGVGFSSGNGRVFRWDGGVESQSVTTISNSPLYDVHGRSPALLFAVGGPNDTPHIYRFSPETGTWGNAQPPTSDLDGLNAVWVVHPKLAFTVGENRSVMRWNGQAWSAHPVPLGSIAGTSEDLSGVVAFGDNALYVVSRSGNIFYFNGQTWQKLHSVSGTAFYDIAGTGPDDLWVVGDNGHILHWPR